MASPGPPVSQLRTCSTSTLTKLTSKTKLGILYQERPQCHEENTHALCALFKNLEGETLT